MHPQISNTTFQNEALHLKTFSKLFRFVSVASRNNLCHCCPYHHPKATKKLCKPIPHPPERGTCGAEAAAIGVGLQISTLRAMVCQPEAQRLCPRALQRTLR